MLSIARKQGITARRNRQFDGFVVVPANHTMDFIAKTTGWDFILHRRT